MALMSCITNFSYDGSGQQCCYDLAGYLMMTTDNKWGSNPLRNHNLGLLPWNEANKIPTMSHWLADVLPFYPCCMWQSEQSNGCQMYRFERRSSQVTTLAESLNTFRKKNWVFCWFSGNCLLVCCWFLKYEHFYEIKLYFFQFQNTSTTK